MTKLSKFGVVSLAVFTAIGSAEAASKKEASPEPELVRAVRESLERLPYYGVFDSLTYRVNENATVDLAGFAFRDSLKKEAEHAVLKVPGVKGVSNGIEDLDWGVADDDIRARVYLSIYRDSVLSRYGTATDVSLANGIGLSPRRSPFGPLGIGNPSFPGFNPTGNYGIHILVSRGDVILVGTVDTEGDKNLAAIRARGVFPVKKVFNELSVRNQEPVPGPAPAKGGIVAIAEDL